MTCRTQAKREVKRQNAERWAAEAAARREQVAAVRADNAALQQRVDSQPYTAEQAARMNAEKCVPSGNVSVSETRVLRWFEGLTNATLDLR